MEAPSVRERFEGCMLGLAIGECLDGGHDLVHGLLGGGVAAGLADGLGEAGLAELLGLGVLGLDHAVGVEAE